MIEQFFYPSIKILTGNINPSQSGPGSNGNKVYFPFPKAPGLETHYQMQFSFTR